MFLRELKVYAVKTLSNNYIINVGRTTLIFDCGGRKVVKVLEKLNLNPKAVFITHLHFDHVYGVKYLKDSYPAVTVYAPAPLRSDYANILCLMGLASARGSFNVRLKHDTEILIDNVKVYAYKTGYHTKHHFCYQVEDILIVGDEGGVIKGIFQTKSSKLRKIIEETGPSAILPGHGELYSIRRYVEWIK